MMHIPTPRPVTRREALCRMGAGFGMLSFASLIADTFAQAAESSAPSPWMIRDPKFKPKAKHVIFLFMNGGLSQVDSFDPKPMLEKYHGQPMPGETPQHERKTGSGGSTKTPFVTSSSRPPTPAVSTRPATPPEVKTLRPEEQAPLPPTSPSPSVAVDSDDIGSGSQDVSPSPGRPRSAESMDSIPAAPVSCH